MRDGEIPCVGPAIPSRLPGLGETECGWTATDFKWFDKTGELK